MTTIFSALGFCLFGYLCGSLPFAFWITRLVKGQDVRDAGSGHATATNTFRQAGFVPGFLVFVLDVSKGFFPTWLALHYAPASWIIPLVSGLVVIGHCWPLFAGFRGGMGLASAGGCIMAVVPVGFLIAVAVLILFNLIIRHSARASVLTGVLITPVLWLLEMRGTVTWISAAVGLVTAIRFLIDWNRKYRELWLDRAKKQ